MKIVFLGHRPFNFVEEAVVRRHVNIPHICVKNLKKHTEALVKHVEKKIIKIMTRKFCIVFDGWNCGDTYYLSVFVTFPSESSLG